MTNSWKSPFGEHTQMAALAEQYIRAPHWHPSKAYAARLRAYIWEQFNAIPLKVVIRANEVADFSELEHCVEDGRVLLVKRRTRHVLLGHAMTAWRAVHDYYGHIRTGHGFGLAGELAAYACHETVFPREFLPFVWQNVVLENAFWEAYGYWPVPDGCGPNNERRCYGMVSPLKFDVAKFGAEVWGE